MVRQFGGNPAEKPEPITLLIFDAWRMMGHQLDWSAVPIVAQILGFDDVEELVRGLIATREALKEGNAQARN